MMLNRFLLLAAAATVAGLLLFGTSASAHADDKTFTPDTKSKVVRGQNPQDGRKNPSFFDRFRQGISKFLQEDPPNNNQRTPAPAILPAVPTQPPKPLTTAEIQQATTTPSQGQQRASASGMAQSRAGTAAAGPGISSDIGEYEGETSILERMRGMRETVFAHSSALKQVARQQQSQQHNILPPTMSVPTIPTFDVGMNSRDFAGDARDFPVVPTIPSRSSASDAPEDVATPARTMPRSEQVPDRTSDVAASPSPQASPRIATATIERQHVLPASRTITSTSPKLDFQFEGPTSAVVNQEITHRIWVTNTGDAPAEGVTVQIEIPSWIDIQHLDVNKGGVVRRPRDDGTGFADLEWKVERIDEGMTYLLVFRYISRQHRAIEFPVRHDFYRPAIIVRTEVQEPKLEMELLGPEAVLWNDDVIYTLLVHNVGNGDAESIRLELQQTSSDESFCQFDEPLRPGETQTLDIAVRAGREQETIDIAVLATGAHDLRSEVKRRIKVLRPKLEMSLQTEPLHFVGHSAEFTVRVRNVGTADAENVVIRAELPLGAKYVGSSEGGVFSIQQQQNVVEWQGRSIPRNEMQTFTLFCEPLREGECRVSVEASEPNGSRLVAGHATFLAEAVVDLDLAVTVPKGPIELGQEVEYGIQVTNIGTKAAEDVRISMTFGPQLEPTNVYGREAEENNGQVFFDPIPTILPGQNVTVKVLVRAEKPGTAPIKAEVVRADASGVPAQLEQRFLAQIFSRRAPTALE